MLLATLKDGTIIAYSVKRSGEVTVSDVRFSGGYVHNVDYYGKKPAWQFSGAKTGHICKKCRRRTWKTRHNAVTVMFEAVAANLRGDEGWHLSAEESK